MTPSVLELHRCAGRWLIALWLLRLAVPVSAQQRSEAATEWEVLENCELAPGAAVDGDSFHVLHEGREYIFRLYFVDAPEANDSVPDRLVDQAAYFGMATNQVIKAGALAAEFTHQTLTSGRITIFTRWQNALGRSTLARFYGVVLVGEKNLAEELVAGGLARIYGHRANWPDGPRSVTFINQLKHLELNARVKKLGAWNESQFASTANETVAGATAPPPTREQLPAPSTVDLNTATAAELDRLPGVGKVIAARIITHRPYRTVEELLKVPGIGAKTMDRLRPLVCVNLASPAGHADGTLPASP